MAHGGVNTATFPDTIGPHHRVITHVQVTFFTHKLLHRGIGIFIDGGKNGEALCSRTLFPGVPFLFVLPDIRQTTQHGVIVVFQHDGGALELWVHGMGSEGCPDQIVPVPLPCQVRIIARRVNTQPTTTAL